MAADPERDPAQERIRLRSHARQLRGQMPKELIGLTRWVLWKYEQRGGKLTKVPWTVDGRRRAHADKPETWGSFELAARYCESDAAILSGVAGMGFMLGDGIVGIDLDDCRDPDTGELGTVHVADGGLDLDAEQIIADLDTYGESSPSGTGVHLLCRGTIPGERRRRGDVEMYDGGRFFTMTGYRLDQTGPNAIEERQAALDTVYARVFADVEPKPAKAARSTSSTPAPGLPDDHELVMRASGAANGAKFARLWAGDSSGYGATGNDGHSEADMALATMLAFYTGSDPARMDRLFRQSGLMRDKWDEKRGALTYGEMTIFRAISLQTARYDPRRPTEPPDDDGNAPGNGTSSPAGAKGRKRYKLTEFGNMERLRDAYGERIRWCELWRQFVTYDGRRWRKDAEPQVAAWAQATVRQMYAEAADLSLEAKQSEDVSQRETLAAEAERILAWAVKSERARMVSAMLDLIKPHVLIEPDEFDAHPMLLNCANGTLDLTTGEMHAHDRGDYLTQMSPVSYDANAHAPRFEQFMLEIMEGRADLVEYLHRALGYTLTGDVSEQCWHLLFGGGENGKSKLMDLMLFIFGDYGAQAEPEMITIQGKPRDDNAPSPALARLRGKRLVAITETEDGDRIAAARVKKLAGGDRLTAREMFGKVFEFAPTLHLFVYTNYKPQTRETTHAFWRRVRVVPFSVNFRNRPDKDPHLERKLFAEAPGVLAWLVRGCLAWQRGGLGETTLPQPIADATASYRGEMDVVGTFLRDCTTSGPAFTCTIEQLYNHYRDWCEESGERPLAKRRLGTELAGRGYEQTRGAKFRMWSGLRLNSDDDFEV